MPDKVSFLQGAAATDAGMTSYHALFTKGGAKKGMKVGIIGVGGLGQFAARMAVLTGCEVYASEISPENRQLAKGIGCKEVVENVMDLAPFGCELIVDYAGFGTTTAEALEAVEKFGKVVVVGMGKLAASINTGTLILKKASVIGSNGGNVDDIKAVYDFLATGELNPHLTAITFDEIPAGLKKLHRREIKGRLVALLG